MSLAPWAAAPARWPSPLRDTVGEAWSKGALNGASCRLGQLP